jgi:PKD repeat protein
MPPARVFGAVRVSLLAVCALAFAACDGADRLTNSTAEQTGPPQAVIEAAARTAALGSSSAAPASLNATTGGTPFGFFHLPLNLYGPTWTGALKGVGATTVMNELEAARKAGASVIISMVGNDKWYKNADGTFSLDKWKNRLGPFKGLNFTSYITDGTVLAHYLIDEPNDPTNWNGTTISPATLEEMALYSKQLWPTLPTIVRVSPTYLKGRTYQYLDGAWAQYHSRFGTVSTWLNKSVTDAKASGLSVVAGMNVLAGGTSTGGIKGYWLNSWAMGAGELEAWGSAILADPYPCALLMWQYNEFYIGRADIKAVMGRLAAQARAKPFRSCRGGAQASPPPPPPTNQPPTAAFTAPSCTAGVPCQFNDASTDPDGSIASRTWTFGDGKSSTLKDPTNTYAAANTYTVTLTVKDDKGASRSVSKNVVVAPVSPSNQLPVAAFTAPGCTAGVACQFNDGSTDADGTIASRTWAFGNGQTSTLKDPTTTYASANTYTVTLTVTDDKGGTNSTTKNVIATTASPSNQPPVAGFTPPSCTVGTACQFNDGSSDPDGTIASRTWTFDDGQTSTLKDPTYVYASASPHTVTLAVTDDKGGSSSVSKTVNVSLPPPTNSPLKPAFTAPICTAGVACQFTDASSDTDGIIKSWSWNFGNGKTSTVRHPKPTYAAAGAYTVTLTLTDDKGRTNSLSKIVTVIAPNSPPTAAFVAPSCAAGTPCQFNDASTDGDGTIATRSWAFGDGTTSTEADPSVTYAASGPYTVTLTVTDDDGAPSTVSQSVTVSPANNPPAAAFTAPTCTAGTPCQFNDASADGDGTIATRSWAFGDGTTSTEADPNVTYAAAGSYTVTLTVTDDDGAPNTVSHDVTVAPAAPLPAPAPIVLSVRGRVENNLQYMTLTWTGGVGSTLDVYRDGVFKTNTPNDGQYTNSRNYQKPITYTYKVCEKGTTQCSNAASVTFN